MRRAIICVMLAMIAVSPGDDSAKVRVTRTLDTPMPVELNISGASLSASLDGFVSLTGVRLDVRWETLKGAGITGDSPVIVRLRNVKGSKALSTILSDVGGGEVRLTYYVEENGTILITTAEEFYRTHSLTQAYYVEDLIDDPDPAKRAGKLQQLIIDLDIEHPWREPPEAGRKAGFGAREKDGMLIVRESVIIHEEIPRLLEVLREGRGIGWVRRRVKN